MSVINARYLHNETSTVLKQLQRGARFEVEFHGKTIGEITPKAGRENSWDEIMKDVWTAQKQVRTKTKNPVLAERARRRR